MLHMVLSQEGLNCWFWKLIILCIEGKDFTEAFSSTIIKMGIGIHTVSNYECLYLKVQAQDRHISLNFSRYQNIKLFLHPSIRIAETDLCLTEDQDDNKTCFFVLFTNPIIFTSVLTHLVVPLVHKVLVFSPLDRRLIIRIPSCPILEYSYFKFWF